MSRQKAAGVGVGEAGGAEEGGGDGVGEGDNFLLIAQTVKLGYEKCMEHQSGTQLFAWLRGLKQRMQPSLTQALRMLRQYNRA